MMGAIQNLRLFLALKLMPTRHADSCRLESTETAYTFTAKHYEIKLSIRNTSEPRIYSRESVYEMLRTVRREEQRMGWRCPEPKV